VVVAGHDDRGLQPAREVPEARDRLLVGGDRPDQVREQPLLLVRLRDRDLAQVDPVRLVVTRGRAVEQVVGADRRRAVALLPDPRRVALAGQDDRPREVVRERGRGAAVRADVARRQRGRARITWPRTGPT